MQLRAFEVRPKENNSRLLSEIQVGIGEQLVRLQLPPIKGIIYHVLPQIDGPVTIAGAGFALREHGMLRSLKLRAQARWLVKPKNVIRLDKLVVLARGDRAARSEFKKALRALRGSGMSFDGPEFWRFPELLAGWAPANDAGRRVVAKTERRGKARFAIVAHVYYPDVWPQIASILRGISDDFDLIVTTTPGREELSAAILDEFPHTDVRVYENRGRDVRPFLCLLEEGRFAPYAYICKIHGKKSADGSRAAILGNVWRNRLFFDLLAGPGVIETISALFEADQGIGMVGSRAYRYPNANADQRASWGKNRDMVLEIAAQMGIPADQFKLDFFGGTMFWVRPEALEPLRKLGLSVTFPLEQGKLDGAVEHAVERLFLPAVQAAGYCAASVDGFAISAELAPLAPDTSRRLPRVPLHAV